MKGRFVLQKAADAFRTISEVAEELDLPQHVLRFWETRFSQIKPMKRGGGRRYYRPDDVNLLRGISHLLYDEGYTIKGVQRILKEQGVRHVTNSVVQGGESAHEVPEAAAGAAPSANKAAPPVESAPAEPVEPKVQAPAQKRKAAAAPPTSKPAVAPAPEPAAVESAPAVPKVASPAPAEIPEVVQAVSETAPPEVKPPINNTGAPFSLSHNVPAHLVDAITEGKSTVENTPAPAPVPVPPQAALPQAAPVPAHVAPQAAAPVAPPQASPPEQKAEEIIERPADVLPEGAADEAGKSGGGIFGRLKGGGADNELDNAKLDDPISHEDKIRLENTLVDLLECKRLLDQIR